MNRHLQLDAEVDRFIAENPYVWERFRLLACKLKNKGYDRWGAKSMWEVLRWELAVHAKTTGESYALNNNYTSRFARKLMEEEDFAGFFETRSLKGGEISNTGPVRPT